MSKYVKRLMMDELRRSFDGVGHLLVVDLKGVDANQDNQMRLDLRQRQISLRVIRNRLARKIFADLGLDAVCQYLEGPSAVAWGGPDIVELAKAISEWSEKIEPLKIKGGAADGKVLSVEEVDALSKLPSREELIGQIAGRLLAPGADLAALLLSPGRRLAGQIATRGEEESAGAPAG